MGEPGASRRAARPAVIEGRSMAVLYGTETGNAEEIAVELGQMAERLHFKTTVDEMDNFKLADVLQSSLVVFVTSTTGQGDMPKNTCKFWKNLRREKLNNTNCLGSLRFAIFGLGDSSYLKFNWAARKLRARLLQLGASEFFKAGEGDERHDNGIDSIYLPWYEELKATLLANYPLPESVIPIPDDVPLPAKYPLRLLSTMDIRALLCGGSADSPLTEDDRGFLASRTKGAVRSHIDHPTPAAEQVQGNSPRRDLKFPAISAQLDARWEREDDKSVNSLDKDNIPRDHPEKYSLKRSTSPAPHLPPPDAIPIPSTFGARLLSNTRVTPVDHWQDVRHLTFVVDHSLQEARATLRSSGNLTLTIYPKNFPEDVQELISLMGWGAAVDTPIQLDEAPRGLYFENGRTTLRDLLTHNLDITAVPKRYFIKALMSFTEDEREKERLQELTAPGNEQEFYDYTCRPRRTTLELLRDFQGVKIPVEMIIGLFPVMRGRDFSVCNGGENVFGDAEGTLTIEILAALVEYKTIIRKPRQGLCSRYIKHLPAGSFMHVGLKPSSGPRLVEDHIAAARPMIAVATGTGIAPIRGIIQERGGYERPGDTLLFFGCRNRAADFYFWQEWEQLPNVRVYPAFSRDRDVPGPEPLTTGAAVSKGADILSPVEYDVSKNYVQHLIRKHAAEVGALMVRNPIVCICGNAGRMPISVRNAFLDALVISGVVKSKDAAERWFSDPGNLTLWQETW
ncbi:NADPH-dependent diflavin oxidoreductase 1 [Madurella mycetomatis]|uniref:NADPH-dependent diflavin oxidoreductase 1 n=1 Tax=Madurella mycetomatis TaxID=100816 RepID=A0A150ASP4_9PEZI|nr:NADPH-dependent diflavin oxidoreductase 1 [Madurella mycetomatis]